MAQIEVIIPVIATFLTVSGTVIVAFISRGNKPVRDILKKTKIEGDGGLVEALGVLQRQLIEEQVRSDKIIKDAQRRHEQEILYYVDQLSIARKEIAELRREKNAEIDELRRRIEEHEARLDESHVGQGK